MGEFVLYLALEKVNWAKKARGYKGGYVNWGKKARGYKGGYVELDEKGP